MATFLEGRLAQVVSKSRSKMTEDSKLGQDLNSRPRKRWSATLSASAMDLPGDNADCWSFSNILFYDTSMK